MADKPANEPQPLAQSIRPLKIPQPGKPIQIISCNGILCCLCTDGSIWLLLADRKWAEIPAPSRSSNVQAGSE